MLSIINPSKLADGLDELESINAMVLTIRHLLESKATLAIIVTAGIISGYFSAFMIIHGEYKIRLLSHFVTKMAKIQDLDFMIDDSLPGMTCFTEAGF